MEGIEMWLTLWRDRLMYGFLMTAHFRRSVEFFSADGAFGLDAVVNRLHVKTHVTNLGETLVTNGASVFDSAMDGIHVNF